MPRGRPVRMLGTQGEEPRTRSFGDGGLRIDLRALVRRPFLVLARRARRRSRSSGCSSIRTPSTCSCWASIAIVRASPPCASARRSRASRAPAATRPSRSPGSCAASPGPSRPTRSSTRSSRSWGSRTGADHVAVVRRRPETPNLEAILSPTRAGAPRRARRCRCASSRTRPRTRPLAELAIAAARGRRLTAVPIEPDPDGDPDLVPLGIAADRRRSRRGLRPRRAGLDRGGATAPPSRRCRRGPRRGRAGDLDREGADQRIADRIADRLRDAYGLRNLLAAPLRVNGRIEGAIVLSRRVDPRPWPDSRQPVPRGGGRRGVRGARPRLLAARGRGARDHRRADRPAEPPLLRRVPRACSRGAAAPRTRSAC